MQSISEAELAKHRTRNDIWIAIHGNVYDVTEFIEEHPGGSEVLLEQAGYHIPLPLNCQIGLDASITFDDIGHSDHARDLLKNFLVAPLVVCDTKQELRTKVFAPPATNNTLFSSKWCHNPNSSIRLCCRVPIAIAGAILACFIAYHYSR